MNFPVTPQATTAREMAPESTPVAFGTAIILREEVKALRLDLQSLLDHVGPFVNRSLLTPGPETAMDGPVASPLTQALREVIWMVAEIRGDIVRFGRSLTE